jgi:hypothetical protein
MAAKDEKAKERWVGWTRDAMTAYTEPDDIKDLDDLVDDMVDTSVAYANAMAEEFDHLFENAGARKRRGKGKGRSRRSEPDPDDDDDDDDDDD